MMNCDAWPMTIRVHGLPAFVGLLAAALVCPVAQAATDEPQRPVSFERDVQPILAENCADCHGARPRKAALDLRTIDSILRGGKSGPVLSSADLDGSLLLERVVRGEMPPGKARRLSADEIARIRAWVRAQAKSDRQGAATPKTASLIDDEDRRFWSFRPLKKPAVPLETGAKLVLSPVDSFLLAKLESKGLSFSPEADRYTLIRRAYLDLAGIPPAPEEVDALLADDHPGAFERLVDRLLAAPSFGERWGRHWLDVAGYVDTVGFDNDAPKITLSDGKWRYRDYVFGAYNEDKAYDRFLTEQIAGDELYDWRKAKQFTPAMRAALIATGYLRTARDLTNEDVSVIAQNFYGIVHDTLEIVGTGLLGLTINCARCHDHKFDPIPQEDYYRLMAIFAPAYNPNAWLTVVPTETNSRDRGLPDVPLALWPEIERHNAGVDRCLKDLNDRVNELRSKDPASAGAIKALEAKIRTTESSRRKVAKIQALYDVGSPPRSQLLLRGNEQSPGPEVQPGFLRVLCENDTEALAAARPPYEGATGRRTALARWLTDPKSPASALVARVIVNRIWKQLFGEGLVPTLDNFGAQGQSPTHPELLEWLSCKLVESGWPLKPLIRLLVTSRVYRQASRGDGRAVVPSADPAALDPANQLLWRMRLRRLESEVVRDAILAVSGDLNRAIGGPPVPIVARPDGLVEVAKDKLASAADRYRRSVYLTTRRAYNVSILSVFDQPLVATNCLKRAESAVPSQSLFMLNDGFLAEQAERFARRVERLTQASPERTVVMSFRLALVRRPSAIETEACRELLSRAEELFVNKGTARQSAAHQALVQLCQTLLNTSEFLFAE
jgi:mono/diheme cytochrome c family protein